MRFSNNDPWVAVGFIRGAHGIDGEVTVEALTDSSHRFSQGTMLHMRESAGRRQPVDPAPVLVEGSRRHGKLFILKFEGVLTRTDAQRLSGWELVIPEAEVEPLPAGFYYPFQLTGCEVLDDSGKTMGTVVEVTETGAGALLAVGEGRNQILIPMVDGIVTGFDLESRQIRVKLPKGLADVNA